MAMNQLSFKDSPRITTHMAKEAGKARPKLTWFTKTRHRERTPSKVILKEYKDQKETLWKPHAVQYFSHQYPVNSVIINSTHIAVHNSYWPTIGTWYETVNSKKTWISFINRRKIMKIKIRRRGLRYLHMKWQSIPQRLRKRVWR